MHEVSIICSAMEEIEYHCKLNNIVKVSKILLAIGKFVAVDNEALRFAFEGVSKGTSCEGAVMEVEEIIPMAYCETCNEEYEVSFTRRSCPLCGNVSSNLTKGNEILLYRIEGE